jgi:hypothetical protein
VPHNEHWSALPVIAYRALVETVGLRTYLPYLALVLALHLVVAALVFRLVRRRAGGLAALGVSAVVLLFGAGFENLYWGFQIGFVGATAAGLAAFEVLDEPPNDRREVALGGLLLVGLATSGVGLFFLAAAAVEVALRAEWRRWVGLLVVPGVAYAAWFVIVGRSGIGAHRDPFTVASALRIPEFVVSGTGDALGAVLGVGPTLGLILAGAIGVWSALSARRGNRLPPRFLAACAGIVIAYGLIALTRAGVTVDQVHYSRYAYVTGVFAIVGLTALISPLLPGLATAPRRVRPRAAITALLVFELAMIWNVRLLIEGRSIFVERAALTRALVAAALSPDRLLDADLDRSLILVPSPRALERIVAAYGSPIEDSFWGSDVEPLRPELLAEARRRLVEGPPTLPDAEP